MRAGLISPEEAKESRFRNIITRSVGFEPSVEPDLQGISVQAGDCFVLCSDGLSSVVPDARIAALLSAHAEPAAACDALVAEANDNGGPDNVTALVVHIDAA